MANKDPKIQQHSAEELAALYTWKHRAFEITNIVLFWAFTIGTVIKVAPYVSASPWLTLAAFFTGFIVADWVSGFVHWLAFQSLYRIGALCPWCMVVWAVTIPIAVWTVLGVWRELRPSRAAEAVWGARYLVVGAWYLLVVVLALVQFWNYWRTLL